VSFGLDLSIRHQTENRASLDTVLRTLWTERGKTGRALEEGEIGPIASRAAGLDLDPFFERYVRGTDEIDFDSFAHMAGLSFGPKPKEPEAEADEPGYLGIRYDSSGGLVKVRNVLSDTPARRAGLSPGDEIIAVNRAKVVHDGFDRTLKRFPPGTPVDLTVFCRGYLRTLSLTLGTPPPEKFAFTPVDSPDTLARTVYEGWLEAKWEPPAKTSRK
jgi:predicted metalloprotease with PDZ domain